MRRGSYDAIVVGARIAGSTAAALLGEQGLGVLLVERVRFPSTTISTHFFRGSGLVEVLARLAMLDEVLALGAPPLRTGVELRLRRTRSRGGTAAEPRRGRLLPVGSARPA